MVKLDKRIGFMGAGQMAEALARGLMNKGVVTASQICCTDPVGARKDLFKSLGCASYDTNLEVRRLATQPASSSGLYLQALCHD